MKPWLSFSIVGTLLLWGSLASGNPIPGPVGAHVYISAERLEVIVSATEATITGSFVFSAQDLKASDADVRQTFMQLPVWIPQGSSNDPSVANFWGAFHTNIYNIIRPTNKAAFDNAIGLKVLSEKQAMPVNAFIMLYQGGDQRPFEYFVLEQQRLFRANPEPDLCCLVFRVDGLGESIQKRVPVEVSYRQPLLRGEKTSHFYYLPIFENMPKEVSTTDTNRYSITLTAAKGCELTITNGQERFKIKAGHSVSIAPQNRQAIRAVVARSSFW